MQIIVGRAWGSTMLFNHHSHACLYMGYINTQELVNKIRTDQMQRTKHLVCHNDCVYCVCAHTLARVQSTVKLFLFSKLICSWGVPSDSSPVNDITDPLHVDSPLLSWTLIIIGEARNPREAENHYLTYRLNLVPAIITSAQVASVLVMTNRKSY